MEQEKVLLTQSGLEKLEQERDNLINVERPKVIEELQLARSQGDLSENADYDAAREKQAHLESRIKEIDYMLQNAEIISEDQMDLKVVKPGTTVTILCYRKRHLTLHSLQKHSHLTHIKKELVTITNSFLIFKFNIRKRDNNLLICYSLRKLRCFKDYLGI